MPEPAPAGNVFQEYFINVLRYKYIQYHGRARRREYWMFCLFYLIFEVIFIVFFAMDLETLGNYLSTIFSAAILAPSVCLDIRRLHDIGKSGWWLLIFYGIKSCGLLILGWGIGKVSVAFFLPPDLIDSTELAGIVAEGVPFIFIGTVILLAGVIISLFFFCRDSQPGENQYGPNPKAPQEKEHKR